MSTPSSPRSRRPLWLVEGLDIAEQRRLVIVVVTSLLAAIGVVVALLAPGIVPPTPLVGAAVGLAALLLGYAAAVAVDAADLTVTGPRHVRAAGAELVAIVPCEPTVADARPLAEAVLDAREGDERVLLGLAATGRTTGTVAAWTRQLGVALAEQGVSVLTVDLASGRSEQPGLHEVLEEGRRIGTVADIDEDLLLAHVGAGGDLRQALAGLTDLPARLPTDLDVLLVALPTAASREVVRAAGALDHLLLVAERGATARVDLIAALDALERSEVPTQAVLVDDVTVSRLMGPDVAGGGAGWSATSPPPDTAVADGAPDQGHAEGGVASSSMPPPNAADESGASGASDAGSDTGSDAGDVDGAAPGQADADGSRAGQADADGSRAGEQTAEWRARGTAGTEQAAGPTWAVGERGVRIVPPTVTPSPPDPAPDEAAETGFEEALSGADPDGDEETGLGEALPGAEPDGVERAGPEDAPRASVPEQPHAAEEASGTAGPGSAAATEQSDRFAEGPPEPTGDPEVVEGRDVDVLRAAGAARAREFVEHRSDADEGPGDDRGLGSGDDEADAAVSGRGEGGFDVDSASDADLPVEPLTSAMPDPIRQRPGDSVPNLGPEWSHPEHGQPDGTADERDTDRGQHADFDQHAELDREREAGPDTDPGRAGLADTDQLPAQPPVDDAAPARVGERPRDPGITGPASTGPGMTGPDSTGQRSTGPGSTAQGSTDPGSSAQGSTGLGSTGPGSTGPDTTGLGSTDPAEPTTVGPEEVELDDEDADDVLHTTAQLAILVDELEDRDQRP